MVNICAVQACPNTSSTCGVSLHKFPEQDSLRRVWTRFINTRRANFVFNNSSSRICSAHFEKSAYQNASAVEMGFSKKLLLKPEAVPTIQSQSVRCEETTRHAKRKLDVSKLLMEHDEKKKKSLEHVEEAVDMSENDLNKSTQCCIKPYHRSKAVQCNIVGGISVGTQTDLSLEPIRASSPVGTSQLDNNLEEQEISFNPCDLRECNDTTYVPENPSTDSECSAFSTEYCIPRIHNKKHVSSELLQVKEKKFIVYESKLKELLEICPVCAAHLTLKQIYSGTKVDFKRRCGSCGFSSNWSSQPNIGSSDSVPAGNLLLSAAILFSGSLPSNILRLFQIMNIAVFTRQTFHRHQRKYLAPTVLSCWKQHQEELISTLEGDLELTGDCRCDSPGHSAKYGTYTFIEQRVNKVIDLQLVQSNEVANANCCELEGFKRSLAVLTEDHHHRIKSLVTDRHVQINKYVREQMIPQGIIENHYFDVWHVAKALHKNLLALSKKKDCQILELWIKSIVNHLYWVATCGLEDSDDTQQAKWLSVVNHVQNIHIHETEFFPECLHEHGLKRKWIKPGSKAAVLLENTLTNNRFLKNVTRLSPVHQTSSLEAFHSLVNRFAPKNESFGHTGMLCRLYLASMHYNENSERLQAVSVDGMPKYSLRTVKYLPGSSTTVRPVKTPPTYDYTVELMEHLFYTYQNDKSSFEAVSLPEKPPLTEGKERPSKAECISSFRSRFINDNSVM